MLQAIVEVEGVFLGRQVRLAGRDEGLEVDVLEERVSFDGLRVLESHTRVFLKQL